MLAFVVGVFGSIHMWDWFKEHETFMMWFAIGSGVFFVLSLVLVPVVIVRMPADYFAKDHPPGSVAWRVVKNALGWPLMVAGVAMLVLPGQGLLTILLALSLVDFPGKRRAERWIVSRGGVLRAANWLRRKYGKPPLKMNGEGGPGKSEGEHGPGPDRG